MAINAGDSDCTTGLSKALYDALLGDGRLPFPSPMTTEQQASPKAICYAIASKVAASVNGEFVGTSWWNGTPQSVGVGLHVVNFDNYVRGTGGSLSGGGWRFTAPSDGWYTVGAMVSLNPQGMTPGRIAYLSAFVGGVELRRLGRVVGTGAGTGPGVGGSASLHLSAGDVLTIRFWHNDSEKGTLSFETGASTSYVDVVRLAGS